MYRYLFPRIALNELPAMFGTALVGGMVAGVYGALHDQLTFAISPEYFTKLKFHQFDYADLGLGDFVFASTVGFLATWWVGAVIAWFLSRRLIPRQPRSVAYRQIRSGFAIVFVCGVTCTTLGYFYGLWRGPKADYSSWDWAIDKLHIEHVWPFVRVAYIHNASYLGGLIGLILALVFIRPKRNAT